MISFLLDPCVVCTEHKLIIKKCEKKKDKGNESETFEASDFRVDLVLLPD